MPVRVHFEGAVALHTKRINSSPVPEHLHVVVDVVAFDAVLTAIRVPSPAVLYHSTSCKRGRGRGRERERERRDTFSGVGTGSYPIPSRG